MGCMLVPITDDSQKGASPIAATKAIRVTDDIFSYHFASLKLSP